MSDVEEPPTKMSKYEEYLEDEEECLEGQEEWLSEGVLTDDDYHIPSADHSKNDSNLEALSQDDNDDTMMSNAEMEILDQTNGVDKGQTDHNIEDTLNSLDSRTEIPEDLDTFLIRKTDGKLLDTKVKEEKTPADLKQQEEDDGNDTDDLLRLLEDNQQVKKKGLKLVKSEKLEEQDSTDDDEFIYERSKVKTLKLAKNALIKKVPSRAEPERMSDSDDDETDASSDEGVTMKKMFGVKSAPPKPLHQPVHQPVHKPVHKPVHQPVHKPVHKPVYQPVHKPVHRPTEAPKKVVKHVVQVNAGHNKSTQQQQQKSILKPTPNKSKIETKPFTVTEVKTSTPFKPIEKKVARPQKIVKIVPKPEEKVVKSVPAEEPNLKDEEQEEIIDEEEFLEDDNFDLDEKEFAEGSEADISKKQRIMKPEMMDEEVPSDEESHSEDGSLYDELPSSDSEDFDDWFTLDIRGERASDYLPLLGSCAGALLSAERRRAGARVATLRHSLSALTDSARRQADALRHAAMALAEIDDTLRAA